jgi:hypothetical protein
LIDPLLLKQNVCVKTKKCRLGNTQKNNFDFFIYYSMIKINILVKNSLSLYNGNGLIFLHFRSYIITVGFVKLA